LFFIEVYFEVCNVASIEVCIVAHNYGDTSIMSEKKKKYCFLLHVSTNVGVENLKSKTLLITEGVSIKFIRKVVLESQWYNKFSYV